MERLGTLCATALVVAACSFALTGCNNIDGKTGTCEPDRGHILLKVYILNGSE